MEIHIHIHHHDNSTNTKLAKIMGALDDVKAALAKSNEKIDLLAPVVSEVAAVVPELAKDIAFIKAKLEEQPGGIDAAGVAELLAIAGAQEEKVTAVGDSLAAVKTSMQELDSQTDSSGQQEL